MQKLKFSMALGILVGILHTSLTVISGSTHEHMRSSNAIVEKPIVWTDIGRRVSLVCKTQNFDIVKHCYWTNDPKNENDPILTVSPHEGQISPGYYYHGKGFHEGECGVTIEAVKEKDLGNWTCNLITDKEILLGGVSLQLWEAPPVSLKPEILSKLELQSLHEQGPKHPLTNTLNVTCCIKPGGKPSPTLHFQINGHNIKPKPKLHMSTSENKNNCITWINATFTNQQNGLKLQCVMNHVSFVASSPQRFVDVQLNVEYPPRIENLYGDTKIFFNNHKGGIDIAAIVRANPHPEVRVTKETSNAKLSQEIRECGGSESICFLKNKDHIDGFTIITRIIDAKKIQRGEKVTLYATNHHGQENITFTFVGEEFKNNEVLYISLIVGGTVVLLIIIIIVLIWIIRHRNRRLFPVKTRRIQTPREEVTVRKVTRNVRSSGDYRTADEIAPITSSTSQVTREERTSLTTS